MIAAYYTTGTTVVGMAVWFALLMVLAVLDERRTHRRRMHERLHEVIQVSVKANGAEPPRFSSAQCPTCGRWFGDTSVERAACPRCGFVVLSDGTLAAGRHARAYPCEPCLWKGRP